MDHERQAALARRRDVGSEDAPLHVPRTLVVVEIEPRLADPDTAGMGGERHQRRR